jgi:glycosyltransferase involved in cell wall biosynthesis
VVIVTRDRCTALLSSLDHIAALGENHRVVVVDNGSTDGTRREVPRRHPKALLVCLDRNLGSAARTAGVTRVQEPHVAFCDDDSWWAPGSLARAERLLDEHPALALVAGRVLVGDAEREDPTCRLMSLSPLPRQPGQPGTPVLGFLACAAAWSIGVGAARTAAGRSRSRGRALTASATPRATAGKQASDSADGPLNKSLTEKGLRRSHRARNGEHEPGVLLLQRAHKSNPYALATPHQSRRSQSCLGPPHP